MLISGVADVVYCSNVVYSAYCCSNSVNRRVLTLIFQKFPKGFVMIIPGAAQLASKYDNLC